MWIPCNSRKGSSKFLILEKSVLIGYVTNFSKEICLVMDFLCRLFIVCFQNGDLFFKLGMIPQRREDQYHCQNAFHHEPKHLVFIKYVRASFKAQDIEWK